MTFNEMIVLVNKPLDRNEMQENILYLFKSNGAKVAAWLEKDELKLKKIEGR